MYFSKLQSKAVGLPCVLTDFYLRDAVSAVIATATWLAGWLAGWLGVRRTPVLYQNG